MKKDNDEVLTMEARRNGHHEYDGGFEFSDAQAASKIAKIYELPDTKDMAAVFLRGVFKSERQRTAAVRLAYKNIKFNDTNHQELLRLWVASTVGSQGLGRLDALFAAINLLAPDMYRVARGMPKAKDERVHRGSDFRMENPGKREVYQE
jgi:hypothetical protein